MRGDTNFKGSDSSDPSVDFLFCATGKWVFILFINFSYSEYIATLYILIPIQACDLKQFAELSLRCIKKYL